MIRAKKQEIPQRVKTRKSTIREGHVGVEKSSIIRIRAGTSITPAVLETKKGHWQAVFKKGTKMPADRHLGTADDVYEDFSCRTRHYTGIKL